VICAHAEAAAARLANGAGLQPGHCTGANQDRLRTGKRAHAALER
jgi:hypothetical protein